MFSCTAPGCECRSFKPGTTNARLCQLCDHDWIGHAIRQPIRVWNGAGNSGEEMRPGIGGGSGEVRLDDDGGLTSADICEVTSLILFGAQAIPIRLKILLDRLLSSISHLESQKLLQIYGWGLADLARGYILEANGGGLLNRWSMCSREGEVKVLEYFLRFPETRSIAAEFLAQEFSQNNSNSQESSSSEADIMNGEHSDAGSPAPQVFPSQGLNGLLINGLNSALLNSMAALGRRAELLANNDQQEGVVSRSSEHWGSRRDRFRGFEVRSNPPESRQTSPSFENVPERLCRSANVTPEPKDSDDYRFPTPRDDEEPSGSRDLVISDFDQSNEPKDLSLDRGRPTATVNPMGGPLSVEADAFSPPSMFPNPMQNLYFAKTVSRGNQGGKQNQNLSQQRNFGSPAGSGSGSSSKRRVSCEECHKTFCDKGALKIHFSAVHLREMHECIVPGCTMLFSSRRSRNRHSANPNPKLHTSTPRKGAQPAPGHYRVVSPPEAVQQYERSILEELNRRSNSSSIDFTGESVNGSSEFRSRKRKGQPTKLQSVPNLGENREEPSLKLEKSELFPASDDDSNLPLDFSTKKFKSQPPLDAESAIKQLDAFTRNMVGAKHLAQPINEPVSSFAHKFWVRSLIAPQDKGIPCPNVNCFLTPPKAPSTTSESRSPSPNKGPSVSPLSQVSTGISADQNSQISFTKTKTPTGTVSIPINEDNPRQCTQCGKLFQNHFSVKTHFQNVHLKLMHKCTVAGCNASFPSKRSRDRHSANQNLHRKLLSGPRDGAAALQGSIVGHMSSVASNQHSPKDQVIQTSRGEGSGGGNSSSATQTAQVNGGGGVKTETTPTPSTAPPQLINGGHIHQSGFRPHDFFPPLYGYQPSFLPFATPGLMNQLAVRMAAGPMNPFFSPQTLAANLAAAASMQAARKVTAAPDFSTLLQQPRTVQDSDRASVEINGEAESKVEKAE